MKNWITALLLAAAALTTGCSSRDAFAQTPTPTTPNTDVNQLRAILQTQSQAAGTQAVEFGMWVNNTEILTTALGNSMTSVPATTAMHYRIGGITEMFQGTLVMMLVDQGRIDLDQKISRWMPNLLGADQVTIRMLVANTAGYPDYVRNEDFLANVTAHPFRQFTDDELIAYSTSGGALAYPPGTSQAYSHTEYVILGQVIEKATGQTMKELYETNILTPKGLSDTQFPTNQEIQAPVLHSFSKDRGVYEDATYFNPSWASATGALTSNLHDLGKWGPIFGSGSLLSPASFQTLTAPTSVGKGKNTANLYFCYGFIYANGWWVQNPSLNGYSGGFAYNPSNGVTIAVEATNGENVSIDPPAIYILKQIINYVTPGTPLNF